MIAKTLFLFFLQIVTLTTVTFCSDSIHVITHNKTFVVTDPSKGFNAYKRWSTFPPESDKYRRAVLFVKYECPDSLRCGEWDYIDNIFLRRKGSANDSSLDIELARMISPYGSRFKNDWSFEWFMDITDFSFLLHDSVEIEFNHTGYENNKDRGWLVTLDFLLIKGIPSTEVVGMQKLWNGSVPYGNDSDKIENYLKPVSFINDADADFARIRIVQTGHGMDDFENCAEFCSKYRNFYFDKELIEQKQIWRKCGNNALFPQAGTWIFDRAGWCPGEIVYHDVYDFEIEPGSSHTVGIEMEPYINTSKPGANYVIESYLFFLNDNRKEIDVSLDEIISPSQSDVYSRQNPVCKEPAIKVSNNGKTAITSMKIRYGLEGTQLSDFEWTGIIEPLKSSEIVLPMIIAGIGTNQNFMVSLQSPNGQEDEYFSDNESFSVCEPTPVLSKKIIIAIKTNNDSTNNFYHLRNQRGIIVRKKKPGQLKANTIYKDTVSLKPGCYEFLFGDIQGDGLDFWFNPEGGYGYVRLLDTNGRLLKAFNSDFGKEIRYQFTVSNAEATLIAETEPVLNIFPVRNPGKFFADIFLNKKEEIKIEITTEDMKKIVYRKKFKAFKEGILDIDISKQPDGFYSVRLVTKGSTVSKKIKVKRD